MKILTLGGTGNLSAECAELLERHGHQLIVVTRGRSTVPTRFQAIHADRKNPSELKSALEGLKFDAVIDFIGYEIEDVQTAFELFHGRTGQYLYISSATVYEKPPRKLPITEDTPLSNPWWEYARKKIASEQWLMERFRTDRFPVTIVRPSHTYSKRWIPNLVSSSTYTVAARLEAGKAVFVADDGETPWTLTAVEDFAVGLSGLVGLDAAIGEAYHVTSDEVLTWNQIHATIAEALGVRDPRVLKIPTEFICKAAPQLTGNLKGDKAHPAIFDNSKIKRAVPRFKCEIPFKKGIARAVQWLREHPDQRQMSESVDAVIEEVVARWEMYDGAS